MFILAGKKPGETIWIVCYVSYDDSNFLPFFFLLDCQIDPGFPSFNEFCRENNIPVTVLSR